MLYYLTDYITFFRVLLAKNDPASKKVGKADIPIINNQSNGTMATVWKIGCSGG